MGQSVFNRYEKKYLLDDFRYRELLKKLQGLMKPGQYGQYTICNIYYDTADDELIRTSIEKPVYKEKLRLRSYGIPALEDKVYLEIKKKYQGIVNKRRISLPLSDAYTYLEQRNIPLPKEDPSESPVSKKKASQKQIMK
ncbi:MAG: VTC domain-containing protein, partial [Clostridiales bacterium]